MAGEDRMDLLDFQDLFRATDEGNGERLSKYLHADLELNLPGVEGVDEPSDRQGYLAFLTESNRFREQRHERTEHLPTHIKIEGSFVAVRGFLKITLPAQPDQYHPYTDLLKLHQGQIIEYNIGYDI